MLHAVLIDDEEHALDILEILLDQVGGVTVTGRYTNPFEALEALQSQQVDAVFLDIQMPGLLGIDAAQKIKAIRSNIQIVFTTAYSEYAVKAFELKSVDYLLKPFTRERLQETVSRFVKITDDGQADAAADGAAYIQCFGGFSIHTSSGILPWKTIKEKELCAFLIHLGGQVDAATVIEAIWPESELNKARTYLYTCISFLRKGFQANGLRATVDKVSGGYVIDVGTMGSDVAEFEELAQRASAERALSEESYGRINELYKGDYLQGLDCSWAVWKREELKSKYAQLLRLAAGHFRGEGVVQLAIDSLQRVLALYPDAEEDGRDLIRLHLGLGKRTEALKVYRQLEEAVRTGLGVELEDETNRLYRSLV